MTKDVNVVVIDLPNIKTREMVIENEDTTYTIFINARLSYDGQLRAYEHAMKHIKENDFERSNVQEIEAVAHEIITDSKVQPISADKYVEEMRRIKQRRKRIRKQMKRDEERVRFLRENCDMFARAENYHLYGDDL